MDTPVPELLFQDAFNQMAEPRIILKADHPTFTIMAYNENFRTVSHIQTRELQGKGLSEIYPLTDAAKVTDLLVKNALKQVIETKKSIKLEAVRYDIPVGGSPPEECWWQAQYSPVLDPADNVQYLICTTYNITGQIKAKNELEKARDMLELAMSVSGVVGWSVDLTTGETNLSEGARKLYALPEGKKMSMTEIITQLVNPKHQQRLTTAVDLAVQNHTLFNEEFSISPADGGKHRWLRSIGKAYYSDEGKPLYLSGNLLDITLEKIDEDRKYDFITMVSHELKTPLTVLKAYVQMLTIRASKAEDSFTAVALGKLHDQIKKMTILINSFLNVSRIELGRIDLEQTDFLLDDLIREKVEELVLTTKNYDVYLRPCKSIAIHADREKIGQVIINLLNNAAKYSLPGMQIEVMCSQENGQARVTVKDKGIGIAANDTSKIFGRFYQVQSKTEQLVTGLGIGLYLCAEIIRHHKGKIGVESILGKGSAFWFSLPKTKVSG